MLQLSGHQGTIHALTFSPDGRMLISAGKDETIRLWDFVSRKECVRFTDHIGDVYCLAMHGDGRALASGGQDRTVRLWDLRAAKIHEAYPKQMASVTGLAWLPQQRILAMASGERMLPDRGGDLLLWNFDLPAAKAWNLRLSGNGFWSVQAAAGPTICFSDGLRSVYAWRLDRQEPMIFQQPHASLHVALSPDGHRLAATQEWTVLLRELRPGAPALVLEGHRGRVSALAFSPDGRILASGGRDTTLRFWRTEGSHAALHQTFSWPTGAVSAIAFSPDGLLAAAAGETGDIFVWDVDP